MSSLDEIRKNRIEKAEAFRKDGINPYPSSSLREVSLEEVISDFDNLSKKEEITVAGRVMSLRPQGALVFFHINDGSAKFQGLIKKENVSEESFKNFSERIDIGDFIEVKGFLFTTQRGEKTLQVSEWNMLSKSIRPLPDKWHGLQDVEEKLRKRYLDIIFDDEIRELIKKKAEFWNSVRNFMISKDFLEVETPVLEVTTGGADARPFVTHHNALDMDVYLRISCGELWQKRLMVAGFEKVFEIGRIFRNEGMSPEHLQDYTQMEFYWGYADYKKGMVFVEELFKYVAKETFGTLKFKIRGFDIDLGKKWEKYDYTETIKNFTGVDISQASFEEIREKLHELGVQYEKEGFNKVRAIDNLWKYCRKKIAGPGFLVGMPVEMSPLAKRDFEDPGKVLRFQPIIAGSELGTGYSELNDPIDQASRFEEQAKLREAGDEEAQMYDHDFVEALEYGMPPTCGFGMSERVFSFLADKPIREAQVFPLLKPKGDQAESGK